VKHDDDFMESINRDLAARRAARQILGVGENASAEEVAKAYRRAAIAEHPDHNGNTEQANRKFALIRCAYELLAFDTPCEALLADSASTSDAPNDATYNLDTQFGHFCWWREKFFGSPDDGDEGTARI
jgi:hypothetical protein